ncbi:helix-turn-helix domain-containing protein [Paenibacillus humicola]|uniref:helix-turn-helix domain-containing protein n=1 Tax=Paenibacillus humicola TaxID=3110540 RepID=UPI00237A70D4|nr:RodZ family helix-turn-helix domain-containing protein [Paenibacillus humicola]
MSDLGALLRNAREQRGLTLEDVQEQTKIRKRYLEAIEEGNYSVLPGSFYVRAFVKNYSETVGLDADEVLRLYQKEIPLPAPEPIVEPVQRPRRSANSSTSDRWSRWGFRALMWSFLLLIVVIVYVFAINRPGGDNVNSADDGKMTNQTAPPPVNQPDGNAAKPGNSTANDGNTASGGTESNGGTADQTPPGGTADVPVTQTTLNLTRTSGKTDYYEISPVGTHKVEIKASGGSNWFGVSENSKDGKFLLQKTLKDGETAEVDFQGPVYINISNAKVLDVTIDGVPLNDGNKAGTWHMQVDPAEAAGTNGETANNPDA